MTDKRIEELCKEADRFNHTDKYFNPYMSASDFFKQSSGSIKGELKFLAKKILINLLIAAVLTSLYYIFR
jgi:hypothetical protein